MVLEEDYGWFFRNTLLVHLLSVEGNQECTVSFHEQRAAQTLSPSVNIITSGTEVSDFSVFAFFFPELASVSRRTDCSSAVKLANWERSGIASGRGNQGTECQYSRNLLIPSAAECRRGWFCDLIPLKWMEFFRNGIKFLNKPFHFYSIQIKLFKLFQLDGPQRKN